MVCDFSVCRSCVDGDQNDGKTRAQMKRLIFLFTILLIAHCCPSGTVIKSDVVDIVSPNIEETLPLDVISDSLITAARIVKSDTVVVVRVEPRLHRVYVRAKPDTVRFVRSDTTSITIIKEEKWTQKLGLVAAGLTLGLFIAFLLALLRSRAA